MSERTGVVYGLAVRINVDATRKRFRTCCLPVRNIVDTTRNRVRRYCLPFDSCFAVLSPALLLRS